MQQRPLIQLPTWDGKLVLAGIFLVGYYGLLYAMLGGSGDLPEGKASIIRDAMLTLGPPIGLIFGALFRSTGAEERRDALRSTELQTAITTPGAPTTADTAADVEEGARRGTKQGVEEAVAGEQHQPPAEPYDRVDRGRFGSIEDIIAPQPAAEPASTAPANPANVPVMED